MGVQYNNRSLKELHERRKTPEQLTQENKELKAKLAAAESDLTNTQVALAEVYEMLLSKNGGGPVV